MSTPPLTPKIVQVPSVGNIQFPGDMSDDQIAAAIQKNFPDLAPKNPYQQAADRYMYRKYKNPFLASTPHWITSDRGYYPILLAGRAWSDGDVEL
jgi:hypothetical protein